MKDFIIHLESLCDSMMNGYINSNYYGKMEEHIIARMENYRKKLTDEQCKEFNQIIDEVNSVDSKYAYECFRAGVKVNGNFDF